MTDTRGIFAMHVGVGWVGVPCFLSCVAFSFHKGEVVGSWQVVVTVICGSK